jgi:hypothetical protein
MTDPGTTPPREGKDYVVTERDSRGRPTRMVVALNPPAEPARAVLARAERDGRVRRRNGTFVIYESREALRRDWRYPGNFWRAIRLRMFH